MGLWVWDVKSGEEKQRGWIETFSSFNARRLFFENVRHEFGYFFGGGALCENIRIPAFLGMAAGPQWHQLVRRKDTVYIDVLWLQGYTSYTYKTGLALAEINPFLPLTCPFKASTIAVISSISSRRSALSSRSFALALVKFAFSVTNAAISAPGFLWAVAFWLAAIERASNACICLR